jgi:phosphatidylglycerophosphatase A
MRYISDWISSGFGSGYARVIPGTFGSAAALMFWLLLHRLGLPPEFSPHLILIATTITIGTIAVAYSIGTTPSVADPQWIVIDEWAGLFIALIGLQPSQWTWVFCAFVLFRVWDACKWGPVGFAERLPGASGIMADDIVAGIAAAGCVYLLRSVVGS